MLPAYSICMVTVGTGKPVQVAAGITIQWATIMVMPLPAEGTGAHDPNPAILALFEDGIRLPRGSFPVHIHASMLMFNPGQRRDMTLDNTGVTTYRNAADMASSRGGCGQRASV